MLILSRFVGEKVFIMFGDKTVEVLVVESKFGGKVRLGFSASPDVIIHRQEVYDDIQKNGDRSK